MASSRNQSTRVGGRSQVGAVAWVAIIGASVLAHGAVVATVHWDPINVTPRDQAVDATEASLVSYSCELEASAASAARFAMCATPFGGDRNECTRAAFSSHQLGYLDCKRRDDEVMVSMIDIDKIKPMKILPIDPVDDVVAAQLLEEQIVKKVEEAQRQIQQRTAAGQVVEITAPPTEIRPENARYLSEYDSQVEKQMVARGSTEKMVARPAPKEAKVAKNAADNTDNTEPTRSEVGDPGKSRRDNSVESTGDGKSNSVEKTESSALAMRGLGSADRDPTKAMERGELDGSSEPVTDDALRSSKGQGDRDVEKTELEAAGGGGGGSQGGSSPDLRPSTETMKRTVGGGSVDKIDDAESGEYTALNSRKWKYASFFNRLKRRVAQHWHPDKVYMRRDPTGKVYGAKDRITVLRVTLTKHGGLAKIVVAKQSGVDFLDDEAARAFREAGPFPNPPGGLADASGNISFAFGFHFEIGGRRDAWRIFRYR